MISEQITISPPRQHVQVTLPDGLHLEAPIGTTIESFLLAARQHQPEAFPHPTMGGILDGRLRELTYPIMRDAHLEPVLLSASDGGRIYRRSLVLLLVTAADELWPGIRVSVRYAVPDGGFFCKVIDREPLSSQEIEQLHDHMQHLVNLDAPIIKRTVPLQEAIALFAGRGEIDKVSLMEQRIRDTLTLYQLRERADYYYGYMVPSTGSLQSFRLVAVEGGFILQYPQREYPDVLGDIRAGDKLTAVFHEADEWLARIGIEDISQLNRSVYEDEIHGLILVAEALHEGRVARIADEITQRSMQGTRLVLIAGPSSSGKTTFAKRLAIQLLAHGVRPFTLELDNYFVDREQTPRDETGGYDFESLGAVNRDLFNQHLLQLIDGQRVQLPRFDFRAGRSVKGRSAQLDPDQIIIIEGIHGLNPDLVPNIPLDRIFRVYASALTQVNIDSHNRVSTTDVRLLRRIVRDANTRGYTATDTINQWPNVRRGEKRNIFPYQENADAMFNSALAYELAALRPLAEPLLLQVEYGTPPHIEANRLLSLLRWVHPLTTWQQEIIPDTSLLREFIGGSNLQDYHPHGAR
jgi:uridine kinase